MLRNSCGTTVFLKYPSYAIHMSGICTRGLNNNLAHPRVVCAKFWFVLIILNAWCQISMAGDRAKRISTRLVRTALSNRSLLYFAVFAEEPTLFY